MIFTGNVNLLKKFQGQHSLYEDVVAAIIRESPQGGIFIDGGAHVGTHTKPMLARPDVSNVVAFEAIPPLVDRINAKYGQEKKLHLVPQAIGCKAGEVEFNIAVDAMGYSGVHRRPVDVVKEWAIHRVKMTTIDQTLANLQLHGNVGLIKLDLEGGELDAMRGASNTLGSDRPIVIFENGLQSTAELYNYTADDFFDFLRGSGYIVFDFFGALVDEAYWRNTLATYMFVAVPSEGALFSWYISNRERIVFAVAQ